MLLLKRRVGESIVIGGSIRVSVVEVRGGSVRIAIDAPAELAVYRAELLDKLSEENARALSKQSQPWPSRSVAPEAGARPSRAPADAGKLADPVITFPQGILGMGANTAFVLYDLEDDRRALVARDDPTLCLLLVDPLRVDPQFPVERAFARYPFGADELAIAAVLTQPSDGSMPTVNLAAPMVFGMQTRKAVQVLLDDERLPLRAPLYGDGAEAHAP